MNLKLLFGTVALALASVCAGMAKAENPVGLDDLVDFTGEVDISRYAPAKSSAAAPEVPQVVAQPAEVTAEPALEPDPAMVAALVEAMADTPAPDAPVAVVPVEVSVTSVVSATVVPEIPPTH
ncbi:MAG: hypothetical protein WAX89_02480 [Alphaproteobacteria bacterium]